MAGRHVVVGRVAGAFGIKGSLRVESWTQPFDNLCRYDPWWIDTKGVWCRYTVKRVSTAGQRLVVDLEGIEDRDAAKSLYNADIAVTEDQLAPLPAGEHYWFQLIGLHVVDQAGRALGDVDGLMETGADHVLIIRSSAGERLIPYVKGRVVKRVDVDAGMMVVDWEEDW